MSSDPIDPSGDKVLGKDRKGRVVNIAPWRDPAHVRMTNATRATLGHPPLLPTIEVEGGTLPAQVDTAMGALIAADAGVFQRAGQLVRIVEAAQDVEIAGVKRAAGTVAIAPVTREWLVYTLGRCATFKKFDGRVRDFRTVDPPSAIAATLLALNGAWSFPVLRGVVTAPTLRTDGSILQAAGYDAGSGLFLVPGALPMPPIDEAPTREQALAGLDLLLDLLDEFEIVDGRRGAHAIALIAAMMTALSRHAFPTAPAFAQDAAKAGSGKSTAGHCIARVTTGFDAPVMSMPEDETELRKALLAVLLAGDAVLMLDNIVRPVESATLCAIVTAPTYKDRILGVSQRVEVPTTVTLLLNGNNVEVVGDLTTRVLVTRLDPQCELPDQRPFRRDLLAHVGAHRAELVAALLCLTRAYVAAGSPPVLAGPSRFREWDALVRRPLLWLGAADPLETQAELRAQDPVRTTLAAVLAAWRETFADRPATVAQAVDAATAPGMSGIPRLREALVDAAGDRDGTVNSRRLGRYLMRHLRRIEGGLRFEDHGEDPLTHRHQFKAAGVTGLSGVSANPTREIANSSVRTAANAGYDENAGGEGVPDEF